MDNVRSVQSEIAMGLWEWAWQGMDAGAGGSIYEALVILAAGYGREFAADMQEAARNNDLVHLLTTSRRIVQGYGNHVMPDRSLLVARAILAEVERGLTPEEAHTMHQTVAVAAGGKMPCVVLWGKGPENDRRCAWGLYPVSDVIKIFWGTGNEFNFATKLPREEYAGQVVFFDNTRRGTADAGRFIHHWMILGDSGD